MGLESLQAKYDKRRNRVQLNLFISFNKFLAIITVPLIIFLQFFSLSKELQATVNIVWSFAEFRVLHLLQGVVIET